MSDTPAHEPEAEVMAEQRPWYRRQLVLFISGSIVIAILLVLIAMALYISSGSAQLDLSRPGYQSVQGQVDSSGTFESFPSSGKVDKQTLEEFQKLYDKQTKQVDSSEAFSGSALDDQVLGIEAPGAGE